VRTGAAAGWDSSGFFETQSSPFPRAFNTMTPRERLLLEQMKVNPYAT
jgi:hypothetical protein